MTVTCAEKIKFNETIPHNFIEPNLESMNKNRIIKEIRIKVTYQVIKQAKCDIVLVS